MTTPRKPDNPLISLLINLVIPMFLLKKLSGLPSVGPGLALVIALAFPVAYGVREFMSRKSLNLISTLGFFSVLLTGGIGLLEVDVFWFAVKEAMIPLILGVFVLSSLHSSNPVVRTFLYNDSIFHIEHIDEALHSKGRRPEFDYLMKKITVLLALSFLLSAFLNYYVATLMVKGAPGTEAFNQDVASFMAWSFVIIALPCTIIMCVALWILLAGLQKLTEMPMERLLKGGQKNAKT